ncbi:hypothetical protein [Williamsia muralis]|uniref:DUF4226 domain-containing protein n=1 Tax=Williamsia marianensis TaxID=85044 RepID=A0ABU4F0A0_WILMA|nr:hypothetical protein [Williamsia muralis]MDV7136921.1 hypothetical protein [Williamsia muralis]
MSVDSAEFAHEMDQIEEARNLDIAATRADLAAALRAAGENLDQALQLSATLGEDQLYDIEYADVTGGRDDAERWIADAARDIRAAYRIIASLP